MTTPIMNRDCDGFAEALGEYLEGDATDAVRSSVEVHAAGCAACAALRAELKTLTTTAAALPQLAPSRDLWSGIAERIDAPVLPMVPSVRQVARRSWARPALAAAALVAATAGVTHYLTRVSLAPSATTGTSRVASAVPSTPAPAAEPTATIQTTASQSPSPVSTRAVARRESGSASQGTAQAASYVVSAGEPTLDNEISKLRRIVNDRRSQLDPRTVVVLEQSMAVIDSAISQSRAALATDPASAFLATQLNRSLEKKVELLRTATLLPASD